MSPRFVVHDVAIAGPATHALVIGVGSYPHLLGGSGPRCADNEGLGQLKSPTASATVFANWLIEEFANASKPLASLAMLISDESNVCECAVLDGHRAKSISNSNEPPHSFHTSDLFVPHPTIENAWKFIGRADDRVTPC